MIDNENTHLLHPLKELGAINHLYNINQSLNYILCELKSKSALAMSTTHTGNPEKVYRKAQYAIITV